MSQPSAEELRQRSQDLLAHIERTEDSLTRQLRKAEPPPAPSAAPTSAMQDLLPAATPEPGASTNFFELSAQEAQQYFRPATELEAGATPAPTQASSETQAASAQMLLRAAEQQRRLAALLPDEKARAEMVQLAEQQESQARTLLASTHAAAASAASTATPATGAAPHPSEDAPPAREDMAAFTPAPLPRVTATLRRDSAQLFKLLLKECPSGVLISKLLPSDSGDERGQLREVAAGRGRTSLLTIPWSALPPFSPSRGDALPSHHPVETRSLLTIPWEALSGCAHHGAGRATWCGPSTASRRRRWASSSSRRTLPT
jgi:hypothetical protein